MAVLRFHLGALVAPDESVEHVDASCDADDCARKRLAPSCELRSVRRKESEDPQEDFHSASEKVPRWRSLLA